MKRKTETILPQQEDLRPRPTILREHALNVLFDENDEMKQLLSLVAQRQRVRENKMWGNLDTICALERENPNHDSESSGNESENESENDEAWSEGFSDSECTTQSQSQGKFERKIKSLYPTNFNVTLKYLHHLAQWYSIGLFYDDYLHCFSTSLIDIVLDYYLS